MKVTIRTLRQTTFSLEIDPAEKISVLKQKIADQQSDAPIDRQKLIYAGRVLADEEIVSTYGIGEGEMIVLMITRPTTTGTSTTTKPTESIGKPESIPSTTQPTTTAPTTTGSHSMQSQPGSATAIPPAQPSISVSDKVVESIIEMGFSREDATRALQASFGNPDRAVEYLLSGSIPVVEEEFQAGGAGANDASMFGSMTNSPQFLESLAHLQQNPDLLAAFLTQIGERNPELLQAIQANPQAFLQALQGLATSQSMHAHHPSAGHQPGMHDSEGEGEAEGSEFDEDADEHEISREEMQSILDRNADQSTHNVVHVTPEELEAINRLCSLGFDRARATEAYFVCDKNEEVAAAYLFEHMDD